MPATYSVGLRSASLTAAGALLDIRSTATDRLYIQEIGISVGVAGASPTVGLGRPAAAGTASTTTVGQAEDPAAPAGTGVMGSAWSTAPTAPANFMRRVTLPASLGAGWVWTWPDSSPLIVPVSASLIVWLIALSAATATAVDGYAKIIE